MGTGWLAFNVFTYSRVARGTSDFEMVSKVQVI